MAWTAEPLEGAHDVEHGGLARSRRTDDGDQLTLVDPQVDASEGHDRGVTGIHLLHVDQLEDRRAGMGLDGEGLRRVRDDQGHDDGTWTRMPTLMPEPLTWTRLLVEE